MFSLPLKGQSAILRACRLKTTYLSYSVSTLQTGLALEIITRLNIHEETTPSIEGETLRGNQGFPENTNSTRESRSKLVPVLLQQD